MENNFIKPKFKNNFDTQDRILSDLEGSRAAKNKIFLLKHNIFALSKTVDFLKSEDTMFILKGGTGAGKSDILDYFCRNIVSENVLVFKILFNSAITLDDILLILYREFSKFHIQKKTVLPKTDTAIFSEKINVYLKHNKKPLLFIFDMFELSFFTPKKQNDIVNFVKYLLNFENIKVVISSRSLTGIEISSFQKPVLTSLPFLSAEDYKTFFKLNEVSASENEIDRIFSASNGQYPFLNTFVRMVKSSKCTCRDLLNEFKQQNVYFSDFLIQKQFSGLSLNFRTLLYFFSTIRVGVSENFVLKKSLATKEELQFLLENNIISKEFDVCFMKDYYKAQFLNKIPPEIKIRLYSELSVFYEHLLSQKPFEREVFISRMTMRNETEYCRDMISRLSLDVQKPKKKKYPDSLNINYLRYTNSLSSEWKENLKTPDIEFVNIPKVPNKRTTKSARYDLTKEDMTLLNLISDNESIENELINFVRHEERISNRKQDNGGNVIPERSETEQFEDCIRQADIFEKNFEYKSATEQYLKALTFKDVPSFKGKAAILNAKLASCYRKIQETDNAVKYFRCAYELYSDIESSKSVYMLLYAAQSYNEVYRFDEAQKIYGEILALKTEIPLEVLFRVNIDLGEIADGNYDMQKAIKYTYLAVQIAEKLKDKELLSESYFKYALFNDDLNNKSMALKYYLLCVQTSQNHEENKFLSSAYSNLALISAEDKDFATSIMYHKNAIEVDKELKNNDGLFFGYTNLAKIYKNRDLTLAFECLRKALKISRRLDDKTAALSVYMELGDCYMQKKDFKQAMKAYFLAEQLLAKTNNVDDLLALDGKLKILQTTIGQEQFELLAKKLR